MILFENYSNIVWENDWNTIFSKTCARRESTETTLPFVCTCLTKLLLKTRRGTSSATGVSSPLGECLWKDVIWLYGANIYPHNRPDVPNLPPSIDWCLLSDNAGNLAEQWLEMRFFMGTPVALSAKLPIHLLTSPHRPPFFSFFVAPLVVFPPRRRSRKIYAPGINMERCSDFRSGRTRCQPPGVLCEGSFGETVKPKCLHSCS